jgi:transcriptional regulatory protein LevR
MTTIERKINDINEYMNNLYKNKDNKILVKSYINSVNNSLSILDREPKNNELKEFINEVKKDITQFEKK